MQKNVWLNAIKTSADPPRAQHYLELLKPADRWGVLRHASPEQARILAALFSGSQTLSEWLIARPDWLKSVLTPENLQYPRQEQGLRREVKSWLAPLLEAQDYTSAFARLREFKKREMLRIATRDLARLADVTEVTREISNLADVCLDAVYQLCSRQLLARYGRPYVQDTKGRWQPAEFTVLGMGKLGGQELNYSSDVDLLFVYSDEGFVFWQPPRKGEGGGKGMSNHQWFTRLAEAFVAEVGRLAPEGSLFRVDLRLRPEGDQGPLVRSLPSYENYYAQWGQTWERMMLIKARYIAGDAALAAEFLDLVQPFRYPRSLNERIFREVAGMKARMETQVLKAGEIDRNVKMGRGGIREIEFAVQALQLMHAGRSPFLHDSHTLTALQKLVRYRFLEDTDAAALSQAYCFFRDIEHRLQMENNLQTHTIPTERKARERLAALMGFTSLAEFELARQQHAKRVRAVYDKLLKGDEPKPRANALPDFAEDEAEWKRLLTEHACRDPEKCFRLLRTFVHGPGYGHVSPRTVELAADLVPRFLALCPKSGAPPPAQTTAGLPHAVLSDPDRVLARLDSFVAAYGTRAALYELWSRNPSLFELLLLLFDRSEFLAEMAIRTPDLVDDLVISGSLRRRKTAEEILLDLHNGLDDEDQYLWLRRYHQTELMRIGLRDILGLADLEQNLAELGALADACVQYALEATLRKHELETAPFAIVGLGKFGGAELNYGSDLDIIFVADPHTRNLVKAQHLATEVMGLLSTRTEMGLVFTTDARLRPDGDKGLLVNTLQAYEEYYRHRAQLWEIQSLTRSRPIAGHAGVGAAFQQLSARLTNFRSPSLPLVAFTPEWKKRIAQMRLRIERERTPPGKQDLAFKTGAGGLMDAEFIAQTLCLAQGWHEPNTLRVLQRARDTRTLPPEDAETLIDNYRNLRRLEAVLRRWSFEGESVLPDDPAPLYRVAVRCGFPNANEFMHATRTWRARIQEVYSRFFAGC
jgi:glutamate-ammonia-ligase adenylyltransferase